MRPVLACCVTAAFVPPAVHTQKPRFFATQEEVDRLRRENAELKAQIEEKKGPLGILRGLFGSKPQESTAISPVDGLFGVAGAVAKGIFSVASSVMRETQGDVDLVQDAVAAQLRAEFGGPVTCEPPFQQSYSSTSINGRVSKRVALVFRAQGPDRDGIVTVEASVLNGQVDILRLDVDGGPPRQTKKRNSLEGTVIDV